MNDTALLPISRGDNFILKATNDHYVCMGWENGCIRAVLYNNQGIFVHSLSVEHLLHCGYVIFPSPDYDEWRRKREQQRLFRALEEDVWRRKQQEQRSVRYL